MNPIKTQRLILIIAILALAACGGSSGSSSGVNEPPDNGADGNGNGPPVGELAVALEQRFASLGFTQPVALLQQPGDNSRWYLLEQPGRIRVFDNDPNVTATGEFVDLRSQVNYNANSSESGLLSMAFHPDFDDNGVVFLYFQVSEPGTSNCCLSQLVRYTSEDGGDTLDTESAQVLLEFTAPYTAKNHFGGHLEFDSQGYLYLSIGDGGSSGDPDNRAQNTANIWGSVIRLDVDSGLPYAIPAGNPFADEAAFLCNSDQQMLDKEAADGNCPELYAWGLRNPWRWSFDRATGDLWLADVGQNDWEEINTVEPGGNYGWRYREGANCFNPPSDCPTEGLIDPVADIAQPEFRSITGGYVYRGSDIPALEGRYVFGDFVTGRLYSLVDAGDGDWEIDPLISDTGAGISSFAEDQAGELYLLDYSGGIFQLIED